eukprot:1759426-Pyramimonas_sp.AAC.1
MRRPSRSPNFKGTPWVWSHGDGRGRCADLNIAPYLEQLTENDYDLATVEYIAHSNLVWQNLLPIHFLAQFNRERRAGKAAGHKSEEEGQRAAGEDEYDEMAE